MEKKCARKKGATEHCRAEWLSHFDAETGTVMSSVAGATDSSAFASTATALRMAKEELDDGRDEAQKILVVISDSLAQDAPETANIALAIKSKARIVFVPATRRGSLSHHTLKLFAAGKGGDGSVSLENSEALDEEAVTRLLGDSGRCKGTSPVGADKDNQRLLPWQMGSPAVLAAVPAEGDSEEPALDASETPPPVMTALASRVPVVALQSADGKREVVGQAGRDAFWHDLTRTPQ